MVKIKSRQKISLILNLMILVSALFLANKWMEEGRDSRSKAASIESQEILMDEAF